MFSGGGRRQGTEKRLCLFHRVSFYDERIIMLGRTFSSERCHRKPRAQRKAQCSRREVLRRREDYLRAQIRNLNGDLEYQLPLIRLRFQIQFRIKIRWRRFESWIHRLVREVRRGNLAAQLAG